jgi:hypothetical protein
MESVLRLAIVEAGLPEPEVNAPIRDRSGRFLGLGDLVFPEWKLIVEYDGGYHFASDRQVHRDIDRLASFADAGHTVIRVHKLHMGRPEHILGRTRSALASAGWVEPSTAARTPRPSSRN